MLKRVEAINEVVVIRPKLIYVFTTGSAVQACFSISLGL
jgi:hypothetical protein